MKKTILKAALLLMVLLLTACTKDYKEDDIQKYIREEMGISSFSILEGPVEVEGEDGYTDRMWTVSTDAFALTEDLVFHVYDDHYWGLEWVTNQITDDLAYQKECVLLETFELPEDFRIEEMTDESGRVYRHRIVCGLGQRADFEKGPIFVKAYREHANSYPTINDTVIYLSFRGSDTGKARDRWLAGNDYSVFFDARMTDEETAEELRKAENRYLMDSISSGALDRMDEYSIAERSAAIQADPYNTEIRRIGEETAAYPGYSYAGWSYYSVPCGTLYRILEMEGYVLTGDWGSFSFVGKDGEVHSFSYDDDRGEVDVEVINAATDLNLDDGTEMETVLIDETLLSMLGTDAETFAAELEAMEGDYYRNLEVSGSAVRIEGKGRELSRLRRIYEEKLDALEESLRSYDSWYGLAFNNMNRVYQGLSIRMNSDVPREKLEYIAGKACAYTALCQVLNEGKIYDWTLEVTFDKMVDGDTEEVLKVVLPKDTIDYAKLYKKLR